MTEEPNWVRRPEAAARTEVRRTATLGAAVARTVGTEQIAAIVACSNDFPARGWRVLTFSRERLIQNPSLPVVPTGEAKAQIGDGARRKPHFRMRISHKLIPEMRFDPIAITLTPNSKFHRGWGERNTAVCGSADEREARVRRPVDADVNSHATQPQPW